MRCKSGDLAVIVYSEPPEFIGRLVTVLHRGDQYDDGLFYWRIRIEGHPVRVLIYGPDNKVKPGQFAMTNEADFPDSHLRPIRDPGDKAVDETLTAKFWGGEMTEPQFEQLQREVMFEVMP